jgi:hypothetical protein
MGSRRPRGARRDGASSTQAAALWHGTLHFRGGGHVVSHTSLSGKERRDQRGLQAREHRARIELGRPTHLLSGHPRVHQGRFWAVSSGHGPPVAGSEHPLPPDDLGVLLHPSRSGAAVRRRAVGQGHDAASSLEVAQPAPNSNDSNPSSPSGTRVRGSSRSRGPTSEPP